MPPPKDKKHGKHDESKDVRRAFEHLSRVQLLQHTNAAMRGCDIETLLKLAQRELPAGEAKNAAELLRAAEHFCFAALGREHSPHVSSVKLSPELVKAVREQFDGLTAKAGEHWQQEQDHDASIGVIYESARAAAVKALAEAQYHQALELVRAAEALAHVRLIGKRPALKKAPARPRLAAS